MPRDIWRLPSAAGLTTLKPRQKPPHARTHLRFRPAFDSAVAGTLANAWAPAAGLICGLSLATVQNDLLGLTRFFPATFWAESPPEVHGRLQQY